MTRRQLLGWPLAGMTLGACSSARKQGSAKAAFASAPAFWVWHRSSPLSTAERQELRECGVKRLYWQVADCEWANDRWRAVEIARQLRADGDPAQVPVFRIGPGADFLGHPEAAADTLGSRIKAWWGREEVLAEVQLDFDCPDRLLADYGRMLRELAGRLAPTKLTVTALASWPGKPGFERVVSAVAGIMPMFYDLIADRPEEVRAGRFQALDAGGARWIEAWRGCAAPWWAGLGNFERVSVFETDGRLHGHLRGWAHDAVFFHPALKATASDGGHAVFEVTAAASIAGTALTKGQRVVWRTADPAARRDWVERAARAEADGVVYFALPGPGMQAAFSARHLTAPPDATLALEVDLTEDGAVRLRNPGPLDLPARACDLQRPGEPGWKLEIRAARTGAFRSAGPGAFMRLETSGDRTAERSSALSLRFSRLAAGGEIRSGNIVRQREGLTWQVSGLHPFAPVRGI